MTPSAVVVCWLLLGSMKGAKATRCRWPVFPYVWVIRSAYGGAATDAVVVLRDGDGHGDHKSSPSCGCFHRWVTGTTACAG